MVRVGPEMKGPRVCPAVLVMCKSLEQALNLYCLQPPSSNGNQVEWKLASAAENALRSPQGDETERVSSNTTG